MAEQEQSIPDDIAAKVREIGRAEWGQTPAHDADGHAAHVAESVNKTAEHFGQDGPQHMQGLYIEGTGTVICHTGTSPNSAQIARALTGAWNWLYDQATTPTPDAVNADKAVAEDGWQLVPVELTQEMLDATCCDATDDAAMKNTWLSLLSAAPKPTPAPDAALIAEAARLIEPANGEAVFYIRVGGEMTQMRVKTKGPVDPDTALQNAIATLQGERGSLSNCPEHATPAPDKELMPEAAVGSWTGDSHATANELRRVANAFGQGFRIVQLLRDAADEIDTLSEYITTPTLVEEPEKGAAGQRWRERWYGSEPQKGSAIVTETGQLVAWLGGDEITHAATTLAVSAHNAALAATNAGQVEAWRPIESAPKDGSGILVIDMTAELPEAGQAWFKAGVWTAVCPEGAFSIEPETYRAMTWPTPTHWRALPTPPAFKKIEVGHE